LPLYAIDFKRIPFLKDREAIEDRVKSHITLHINLFFYFFKKNKKENYYGYPVSKTQKTLFFFLESRTYSVTGYV